MRVQVVKYHNTYCAADGQLLFVIDGLDIAESSKDIKFLLRRKHDFFYQASHRKVNGMQTV